MSIGGDHAVCIVLCCKDYNIMIGKSDWIMESWHCSSLRVREVKMTNSALLLCQFQFPQSTGEILLLVE